MADIPFPTEDRDGNPVSLPTAKLIDETLRELIGEDVSSPAANTVMARLTAIAVALGAIDASDASAANQATLNTAVGSPADTAWTGTGNAGLIALFKAVALQMLDQTAAQVTFGTLTAAQTAAVQNAQALALGTPADATTVSSVIGLLKLLGTYMDGQEGSLVQIGGYLDTLEAGIGATTDGTGVSSLIGLAKLQNTYLDGLEGAVGTPGDATSVQSLIGLAKLQNQLIQAQSDIATTGYSLTGGTYAAPTGVTIAASTAGPTTVTLPRSGYYALDVSFTGTSPSLKVQILGVDGTWLDVVTRTVSGAASDPIQFPAGAQIRLFNASAGSLTAVKGRVS